MTRKTPNAMPEALAEEALDAASGAAGYLKYELENALISGYSVSGSAAGGSKPTETLALNFEQVRFGKG